MSPQSANVFGCARVSTKDQVVNSQGDALLETGAVKVFQEHSSGVTQARPQWPACLEYLQPGNVFVVTDLPKLGRSAADLSSKVGTLGAMRVGFRSLAEPWLDTTTAHRQLTFNMFAALAEYERSRLSERTRAGLAAARARGRKRGRPRIMAPAKEDAAHHLRAQWKTLQDISAVLGVSLSTVVRTFGFRNLVTPERGDR